jgi:rhomboid protease GluP
MNMVFDLLEAKLLENEFQVLNTNVQDVKVFYKQEKDLVYLLNTVIYKEDSSLREEGFQNILTKTENYFITRGYGRICLLSLIITDNIAAGRKLTGEDKSHWFIQTDENRLYIYEDQPVSFLDVKKIVEEVLEEAAQEERPKERNDIGKREKGSYVPVVTILLIAVNILVFLFAEMSGSSQDAVHMIRMGAMFPAFIIEGREYYRLFTSMFLHFGITHLVNNMVSLFFLGSYLEEYMGRIRFAFLYLLSGVGSGLCSLLYHVAAGQDVVSAGASGAIFGVIGGLFYVVIKNKGRIKEMTTRKMIFLIVFSLYHGITSSGVDNSAHVGGLLFGIIIALVSEHAKEKKVRR